MDQRASYKPDEVQTGEPILPTDFGFIPTGEPIDIDPLFFSVLNFEEGYQQDAAVSHLFYFPSALSGTVLCTASISLLTVNLLFIICGFIQLISF